VSSTSSGQSEESNKQRRRRYKRANKNLVEGNKKWENSKTPTPKHKNSSVKRQKGKRLPPTNQSNEN